MIALRGHPRLPDNPNECLATPGRTADDCSFSLADTMPGPRPDGELLRRQDAAAVFPVDLSGQICPEGTCRATIGNVRVFMDYAHVTSTYAVTMQVFADQQLRQAGWRWS